MTVSNDSALQQQQAAQAAEAMRQAQKASKPTAATTPSVKFAQVLKNAQQTSQKQATTRKLQNPVSGAKVVKNAVKNGTSKPQSKIGVAANANASSSTAGASTGTSSLSGLSSSSDSSVAASAQLMELNQDFNLQYLNLQENQQAESRQFTALSNVSKTKSDTAKNSLSNVK